MKLLSFIIAAVIGNSAVAQSFINLNFENATIVPDGSPFRVNAWQALPGWTNGYPSNADIFFNDVSLGGAAVSIHDTNDSTGYSPIQGGYSVLLQGANPGVASASIGQTGQIPGSAHSLTFWGQLGNLMITFNSQTITYFATGSGPNYTIYGADISAFAGQTGQLLITAPSLGGGVIDNLQFSSQMVPEPSVVSIFALGGLVLGLRRWRNAPR